MATPSQDELAARQAGSLRLGDTVRKVDNSGSAVTASTPVYIDSSSTIATGGFPFAVPMIAGATDTSFSVFSVTGASTGSANELMHQTLVDGAQVTTFTKTGFLRVTVTDSAGNITSGAHYIQIGTLT